MSKKNIRRAVFPALVALTVCALYNGLTVRQYSLEATEIGKPVTIVLISDLHNSLFGKNQKALIDLIKKQAPDLILITGDIVDSIRKTENAEIFLSGINGICPVYYVTGNHEYRTRHIGGIHEMLRRNGVNILSDSFEPIEINGNRIILAGVDDPEKRFWEDGSYSQKKSMQKAFADIPDLKEYKILLSHRPERIEDFLPYGFDLVVTGHAHGGQLRIPFLLNGLYSPGQGIFPKLAGGRYDYGRTTMIVSRGTSFHPIRPRVFNPPEVVAIKLSGAAVGGSL